MIAQAPELNDAAPKREVRITRIGIEGYKAIDSLELDLPRPKTVDEPDAFVLGSKNGVGKTSVLEACAIALLSATYVGMGGQQIANPSNVFVRSGAAVAVIKTGIRCGEETYDSEVVLSRKEITPRHTGEAVDLESALTEHGSDDQRLHDIDYCLPLLLGIGSDPLIAPPVLLFHSYRKVREGSLAIESMVNLDRAERKTTRERFESPGVLGAFKALLIQAMMARSGLFEGVGVETDATLEQLNRLMQQFALGRVDKLRPQSDGTYELRVAPINGGPSYSFDGLSSGQKEIIATLFLIWHTTREAPSVVLIDEPELHLNAEWQRLFVHTLWSLAPQNQYIMATHSEDIFGSVTEDRRLLLREG